MNWNIIIGAYGSWFIIVALGAFCIWRDVKKQ